jgi:mono/diheme cytochrome c family protein
MKLRYAVASLGILSLLAFNAAGQTIKKVPAAKTSPADGQEMYTEYCAVCHGATGKGDGPAVAALKRVPTDLSQLAAKNGGKFPDQQVAIDIKGEGVTAAHGSRDMPIWGKVFRGLDADANVATLRVKNLTDYIKSLQAK